MHAYIITHNTHNLVDTGTSVIVERYYVVLLIVTYRGLFLSAPVLLFFVG